jgi:hypothetical protein
VYLKPHAFIFLLLYIHPKGERQDNSKDLDNRLASIDKGEKRPEETVGCGYPRRKPGHPS